MLRAASAAGLEVAPQGTGHGAAPLAGRLGDAVLLRTSAIGELSIDADRRAARVGAGVLWGDLADAAGTAGLAGLHPSSPDVGVVGYSIGGGIGWYARRLGLQCNAITAAEVVLADGTFVRATADADAELFWGLRGGGAPLGVVTALEFQLFEIDSAVAGYLAWDWTQVERVLPPGRPGAPTRRTRRPRPSAAARPADPVGPRRAAGPPAGRHRRRGRSGTDARGRRDPRAAAGPATGDRHLAPGAGRVARPAAPGAGGAQPRVREQRPAHRAADAASTPSSRPSARIRAAGCCSRSSGSSAGRCPRRSPRAVRWIVSTASSSCSASGRGDPGDLGRLARGRRPAAGRAVSPGQPAGSTCR